MIGGKLYRNGIEQVEEFVFDHADYEFSSTTVENGSVFFLGDKRCCSYDSSDFGCIPFERIIGRVL